MPTLKETRDRWSRVNANNIGLNEVLSGYHKDIPYLLGLVNEARTLLDGEVESVWVWKILRDKWLEKTKEE